MKFKHKVVVAGKSPDGEEDFYFVKVGSMTASANKIKSAAKVASLNSGYVGPFVVFDESFSGWSEFEKLFVWETASIVDINGKEIKVYA